MGNNCLKDKNVDHSPHVAPSSKTIYHSEHQVGFFNPSEPKRQTDHIDLSHNNSANQTNSFSNFFEKY